MFDGGLLRETEIENFGVAALGDEKVGRLDVAMNNTSAVRGVERVSDFDGELENLVERKSATADALFERLALEKFHGQKPSFAVFLARLQRDAADFVNGANVRMIDRGSGARFSTKAFEGVSVANEFVGQEFKRHEAAKVSVLGFVDHAHAATADFFDNAIVGDGLIEQADTPFSIAWRRMVGGAIKEVNEYGEMDRQRNRDGMEVARRDFGTKRAK